MAAGLYALRGVEIAHEWTGPVTMGGGKYVMKYLISDYKPAPLPFFYLWPNIFALYFVYIIF